MRDVSKGEGVGGSPEERPYDVSREKTRYVTFPLITYSRYCLYTIYHNFIQQKALKVRKNALVCVRVTRCHFFPTLRIEILLLRRVNIKSQISKN